MMLPSVQKDELDRRTQLTNRVSMFSLRPQQANGRPQQQENELPKRRIFLYRASYLVLQFTAVSVALLSLIGLYQGIKSDAGFIYAQATGGKNTTSYTLFVGDIAEILEFITSRSSTVSSILTGSIIVLLLCFVGCRSESSKEVRPRGETQHVYCEERLPEKPRFGTEKLQDVASGQTGRATMAALLNKAARLIGIALTLRYVSFAIVFKDLD